MRILFLISLSVFFVSCGDDYTPKPRGHFKIDFLPKEYRTYQDDCPFSFTSPAYAIVVNDSSKDGEPCWKNVQFPYYHATLHLTYKPLDKFALADLTEESRKFVYEHTIKADAIDELLIRNDSQKVYGVKYILKGNTATPLRFFVTDSSRHFLDGAFYFNHPTVLDSIQPVQEYLLNDVDKLISEMRWR